ncbi:MAG: hypothetical protein E7589_02005 [Ruminococcaceae bacterium]|nr:hypothetical protein [Oscillospiraceae bacterium]
MYKSRGIRIVGYVLKAICLVLIFGTIGILLWRIFSSGDPESMNRLQINDKLCEAYGEHGEDLTMYWLELEETTSVVNKNYGYFSVTRALFIEEAEQVQVTFRYNNSTIKHLKEDYGLSEMPSRDEELYDVSLVVAYDLTPEDTSDNLKSEEGSVELVRYYPTSSESDKKNVYNYRKLVFDGVDMNASPNRVLAVYVDIYYNKDINYDKDSYGTLCVYDYITEEKYGRKDFEFSAEDIKAIKAYAPKIKE